MPPLPSPKNALASRNGKSPGQGAGAQDPFLDDDRVPRQGVDDAQHRQIRRHRLDAGARERAGADGFALRRPVRPAERRDRGRRLPGTLGSALALYHGRERGEGLLHVGAERDLRRVVLPHLPVPESDLDHRQAVRHRVHVAVDGHAQHVRADAEHQVTSREGVADLALIPGQRAHEGRMLGEEVGAVADRLLVDRRTEQLRDRRGFSQGAGGRDLVAGHDQRTPRGQQPIREAIQRRIARTARGVDPRGRAELQRLLLVQDVAGQRDEHRPGRRGRRHLRRAAHDARQVPEPGDLHRPFHERLRDGHERGVEHRLGEPVPLLLLSRGHDYRGAHPLRVVEGAHGVAEAWRDVDVARAEVAGGARVAVRHRHHQRLLQRHDVGDRRPFRQRGHDRELGGAGVPEQMRHALALEQGEERLAAEDGVRGVRHGVAHDVRCSCRSWAGMGRMGRALCRERVQARPTVRSSTQFANECTTGSCTESLPEAAAGDSRPACWRSEMALSSGMDLSQRR